VALAGRNAIARERVTNVLWLKCIHRLTHTRNAAWHGCDEPFTFVVPAQEAIKLRLLIRFADEQEQVALFRLALENRGLDRLAQFHRPPKFEERAVTTAPAPHVAVQSVNPLARPHPPCPSDSTHIDSRTTPAAPSPSP